MNVVCVCPPSLPAGTALGPALPSSPDAPLRELGEVMQAACAGLALDDLEGLIASIHRRAARRIAAMARLAW